MQYRVIIVSGSVPATRNQIYKNFFIAHAFRFDFFFDLFETTMNIQTVSITQ
jgi:hypothetical protein